MVDQAQADSLFREFVRAEGFPAIMDSYQHLCRCLNISVQDYDTFYEQLKANTRSDEAKDLWKLLDAKAQQTVYDDGNVCTKQKVFIIGAGPCGLRMAIEARLLGSHVVVVEMRNYVTRNNVLHLWPSVIHDLKSIGTKIFFRRFCTGSIDHISIRRLQSVLLKVALILGVEVHAPVKFLGLNEPTRNGKGWTARLEPDDHPASAFEFDFIVGAEGRRISLKGFRKKCFRAKQALAITFNLENQRSKGDNQVSEMAGSFQSALAQFNNLRTAGIEVENLVYFRDETHYFVMTTKKTSLLKRKVFKEDKKNTQDLLSWANINRAELLRYARDVADIGTDHKMPQRDFSRNHHDEEDIALFDFTAVYQCQYSTVIRERFGRNLVMTIVGDGLTEPFWPTGSGAGRGFLGVMDAAWLLRMCGLGHTPLECLAEKESIFTLMANSTPSTLWKSLSQHTIDPATRYRFKSAKPSISEELVKHLFVQHDQNVEDIPDIKKGTTPKMERKKPAKRAQSNDSASLLRWYQDKLKDFKDLVPIDNLDSSWKDGRALCLLIYIHRPKLMQLANVNKDCAKMNLEMALRLIHQEFGLESWATPEDILNESGDSLINKLTLTSYLGLLQEHLLKDAAAEASTSEPPAKKPSVVLRELSNIEPELMGMQPQLMGMDAMKYIANVDRKSAGAQIKADAKFGVPHPATDEELLACSGKVLKQVQKQEKRSKGSFMELKGRLPSTKTDEIKPSESKVKPTQAAEPSDAAEAKNIPSKSSKKWEQKATDVCGICGKRLYFVERTLVSGCYIHKECLRCSVCDCKLRPGNAQVQRPEGDQLTKFYCFRHAYEAGLFTARQQVAPTECVTPVSQTDTKPSSEQAAVAEETQETDATETAHCASSDEEFFDTEDNNTDVVLRTKSRESEPREAGYRDSTSMKLLLSQQIQDDLEDVDTEGRQLEERGKQIEESIKKQSPVEENPELVDEWMDMMKKKHELREKESKLLLQMKMLQLQERQKQLLVDMREQMEVLRGPGEMEAALQQLDRDTSSLEDNMSAIKHQIANLKFYLDTTET